MWKDNWTDAKELIVAFLNFTKTENPPNWKHIVAI